MSTKLDRCVTAYQEQFAYSLDNRLMLNWYPHRVLRLSSGDSMLEFGLGHGYTAECFSQRFDRYVVIVSEVSGRRYVLMFVEDLRSS